MYICIIGVAILLPVIIPPDVVVTSQQPADGQLRISAIYTQNSDLYLAADSDIYRINQSPSQHNVQAYFRRAKSKNQHCPQLKINCYQQSSIHLPIYSNSQMFILNTDIRRKYVCDLVEINHLSGDIDNKSPIT